jgi:hypothetical protein
MYEISVTIVRGGFLVRIQERTLNRGVIFVVTVAQVVERNIRWSWVTKNSTKKLKFLFTRRFSSCVLRRFPTRHS